MAEDLIALETERTKQYELLMKARKEGRTDGDGPEDVQFLVEVDYGEDSE